MQAVKTPELQSVEIIPWIQPGCPVDKSLIVAPGNIRLPECIQDRREWRCDPVKRSYFNSIPLSPRLFNLHATINSQDQKGGQDYDKY